MGFSYLDIAVGPHGYEAPARWYFPTQADGSVDARGVIYLSHGFGATGGYYSLLATALAQGTDCIVVTPTVSSVPFPGGAWLMGTGMQHAVGSLFLGSETALNASASQAGYHGTLPQSFVVRGTRQAVAWPRALPAITWRTSGQTPLTTTFSAW